MLLRAVCNYSLSTRTTLQELLCTIIQQPNTQSPLPRLRFELQRCSTIIVAALGCKHYPTRLNARGDRTADQTGSSSLPEDPTQLTAFGVHGRSDRGSIQIGQGSIQIRHGVNTDQTGAFLDKSDEGCTYRSTCSMQVVQINPGGDSCLFKQCLSPIKSFFLSYHNQQSQSIILRIHPMHFASHASNATHSSCIHPMHLITTPHCKSPYHTSSSIKTTRVRIHHHNTTLFIHHHNTLHPAPLQHTSSSIITPYHPSIITPYHASIIPFHTIITPYHPSVITTYHAMHQCMQQHAIPSSISVRYASKHLPCCQCLPTNHSSSCCHLVGTHHVLPPHPPSFSSVHLVLPLHPSSPLPCFMAIIPYHTIPQRPARTNTVRDSRNKCSVKSRRNS